MLPRHFRADLASPVHQSRDQQGRKPMDECVEIHHIDPWITKPGKTKRASSVADVGATQVV